MVREGRGGERTSGRASSPTEGATASIRVSPFVLTWAELLGLSLTDVAAAAGLPHLAHAEELGYDETLAYWAALESLTGDPVVGLTAGSRFTIAQMGVVGPSIAHATHLDAALDVLARVMAAFARNTGIRRVDGELGAGLEYRIPTLRSRHGLDTIFAGTVALLRACTGASGPGAAASHERGRGPLLPIAIEHQMPAVRPEAYERFFGVVPTWNAPSSRLWFSRADLARPFRGASPALARLLAAKAPALLAPSAPPSAASVDGADLERAFWRAHDTGEATVESMARLLDVSPRTLQRRLTERGTTFAAARSAWIERRATSLLTETELSIEEIAARLGYGSRAAFERAYTRWTGRAPASSRAR